MKIIKISQSKITVPMGLEGIPVNIPVSYLRFGLPPEGNKPSRNWLDDIDEKGVSVYKAWFDPKIKKFIMQEDDEEDQFGNQIGTLDSFLANDKKIYLVKGIEVGSRGADNETLLNPETVKVIKEVSRDDVVLDSNHNTTLSGKTLESHETPNYENEMNIEVEEDLKNIKLPKVEIKTRTVQVKKETPYRGDVSKIDWNNKEEAIKQWKSFMPEEKIVDRTVYDVYIDGELLNQTYDIFSKNEAEKRVRDEIASIIFRYRKQKESNSSYKVIRIS